MLRDLGFCLLVFSALPVMADRHPIEDTFVALPDSVAMGVGGSAKIELELRIPKGHHAYVRHANKNGRAIPVSFRVPAESGFQLSVAAEPKGARLGDEIILRGKGKYALELSELAMNEFGKDYTLPLSIRVQLCGEGEAAICYMPETIEKVLRVKIDAPEILRRAQPDTSLPWIDNRAAALEAAKLKKVNVFALISNPERCGACVQLESRVLPDPAVNKMLRERFVVYRVPRNEYRQAPIKGSFGIPFYFIINADGQNQQHWMGAPGPAQFIQRIEPFAAQAAAPVAANNNGIPLNSGGRQCVIPLKQSFAYQATQKGDFRSSGNMRFVPNNSAPGTYTVLTLDRTGEIENSNSARVVGGALVVERYLGGNDLVFECSAHGVNGQVPAQSLAVQIELR
ncbi:MAG: thioredoxin family protein [Spirochaetota bacterium]